MSRHSVHARRTPILQARIDGRGCGNQLEIVSVQQRQLAVTVAENRRSRRRRTPSNPVLQLHAHPQVLPPDQFSPGPASPCRWSPAKPARESEGAAAAQAASPSPWPRHPAEVVDLRVQPRLAAGGRCRRASSTARDEQPRLVHVTPDPTPRSSSGDARPHHSRVARFVKSGIRHHVRYSYHETCGGSGHVRALDVAGGCIDLARVDGRDVQSSPAPHHAPDRED